MQSGYPKKPDSIFLKQKRTNIEDIKQYDAIIFGGGIYATGISGIDFLKKHYAALKDKKIAVFCVGASPESEEGLKLIREHNFKGELSDIPLYYFRGAWELEKMGFIDKTLCKFLQKQVRKKSPEDMEIRERALYEAGDKNCDWTDKNNIEPILRFLK